MVCNWGYKSYSYNSYNPLGNTSLYGTGVINGCSYFIWGSKNVRLLDLWDDRDVPGGRGYSGVLLVSRLRVVHGALCLVSAGLSWKM